MTHMIGVDISDKSIKIAEVIGRKKTTLRTVCWSPLAPNLIRRGVVQDVPAVIAALQDAFKKCSPVAISGESVVASIPETQSFVRILEIPVMSQKEMDEAVKWAVRRHIPFDLDRVYLDWQPVGAVRGKRKQQYVIVGAVQKGVVDPLLQVLDGVGLRVIALELEVQAIVRSILPLGAVDVHGILIVDLGATSTNIIFFDGGAMKFTSSVQVGGDDLTRALAHTLHIKPSVAAEKKATIGVLEREGEEDVAYALRDATNKMLLQIRKVVREMTTQLQGDQAVRAIVLSGGSANLPGIQDVFADVFPDIPVQMANPWVNILAEGKDGKMPLSAQDASHFVTALGLALREVEYI